MHCLIICENELNQVPSNQKKTNEMIVYECLCFAYWIKLNQFANLSTQIHLTNKMYSFLTAQVLLI